MEYIANFSDDELDTLSGLMGEYTSYLKKASDKLENGRIIMLSFFAINLMALPFFLYGGNIKHFASEVGNPERFWIAFLPMLLGAVIGLFSIFLLRNRISSYAKEVSRLTSILLRLITRSSQLRDAGHLSFRQEMYLDIRLADAESTSQHAMRILKSTSPFLGKQYLSKIK